VIKIKFLTKSLYLNGLQCPKYLWFSSRNQLPEISLYDHHKFSQGREFEKYVKKLFPEGKDLGFLAHRDNINETLNLMSKGETVFEATIIYKNLLFKGDIIRPNQDGWSLYEIKASTEVKDEHIPDLAFQKYICNKNGFNITKCFIEYLNKNYQKENTIDPRGLIIQEDVTDRVEKINDIEGNINSFLKVIESSKPPESLISKNCNKPYECPLKEFCRSYFPEYHIFQLSNWRTNWKLFEKGILDIKDIPDEERLSLKDQIIKDSIDKNIVKVEAEKIKKFLSILEYPIYYLDFETFDTAVPIYNISRPYQKIPFQYSLHIQEKNNDLSHIEFLAEGNGDPRLELLNRLKNEIGRIGSIVVYNKTFEKTILKELARDFPEYMDFIQGLLNRIVDLADPFRNFSYYNPVQKGSYSIKAVLPAVTGIGYTDLEIGNGTDASMKYFYSHIKKDLEDDKEEIRNNLLKYCCLDTEGMVLIVQKLKEISQNK